VPGLVLEVWHVDGRLGGRVEGALLDRRHDADHLAAARRLAAAAAGPGVVHADPPADGAPARPVAARGFGVDDGHRRRIGAVALVEGPAAEEGRPAGAKEAGADPATLRRGRLPRIVDAIVEHQRRRRGALARHAIRQRHGAHRRQSGHPVEDVFPEGAPRRAVIVGPQIHAEHGVGPEAGVDVLHAPEAAQQQPGSHREHHGAADLGDDERRKGPAMGPPGQHPGAAQRGGEIEPGQRLRRHPGEQQRRTHRDGAGRRQRGRAQVSARESRQLESRDPTEQPQAGPGGHHPQHGGGRDQEESFRHQLLRQAPVPGAQAHPQRHLVAALHGPGEQQGRDVDACRQQDQRHGSHDDPQVDVNAADQVVLERHEPHAHVRRLSRRAAQDGRQVVFGHRPGRAGREPACQAPRRGRRGVVECAAWSGGCVSRPEGLPAATCGGWRPARACAGGPRPASPRPARPRG